MNIIVFTTSFWNSPPEFMQKCDGRFGLVEWEQRVNKLFLPDETFIACGTWSDPEFTYAKGMTSLTLNSGAPAGGYDVFYRQYCACAFTAAMAYALNRNDWDLLVFLDTDCLVGEVDFDALLKRFMARDEVLLDEAWCSCPGGPFKAFKRAGAAMYLHQRRQGNIITPVPGEKPLLFEEEMAHIFHGNWWNPWPNIYSMRHDYPTQGDACLVNAHWPRWPFIRQPHPGIIDQFIAEKAPKAVPVTP